MINECGAAGGENWEAKLKNCENLCLIANLFTTNSRRPDLGSKLVGRDENPSTNRLSYWVAPASCNSVDNF
jgi:hypothetical protein